MRKIPAYCYFAIASLVVVVAFVTAATYTQLAVAIVLYPVLVYFAFKVFPRKEQVAATQPASVKSSQKEAGNIADTSKREFLKLIGVSGISFLLYSIFAKKREAPFFTDTAEPVTVSLQDSAGHKIDPVEKQPTDGYRLTEVDDSIIAYYGFTHKDGSWFIMKEDTEEGSVRYARGDSNFITSWADREHFKYDYFTNIF